jgi:hypothetical protein
MALTGLEANPIFRTIPHIKERYHMEASTPQ